MESALNGFASYSSAEDSPAPSLSPANYAIKLASISHDPKVRRAAYVLCGRSTWNAQDLIQQTCVHLLGNPNIHDGETIPALFKMAMRNLAIDTYRKLKHVQHVRLPLETRSNEGRYGSAAVEIPPCLTVPATDDVVGDMQEREIFYGAAALLPPQQRFVFDAHVIEEKDIVTIAKETGHCERTVSKLWQAAQETLKERIASGATDQTPPHSKLQQYEKRHPVARAYTLILARPPEDEERRRLEKALSALSQKQREIFGKFLKGAKYENLVTEMKTTEPAVQSRIRDARRRVEKLLADQPCISSPKDNRQKSLQEFRVILAAPENDKLHRQFKDFLSGLSEKQRGVFNQFLKGDTDAAIAAAQNMTRMLAARNLRVVRQKWKKLRALTNGN